MKKIFLHLALLLFIASTAQAQEFNCEVTVNGQKAVKTDPKVFKTLETGIRDFMNGRKWTDDVFEPEEKIECDLFLTITSEPGENTYTATLTIQSSRPVFNSSYDTPIFKHLDKDITFEYKEFDPLEFNENDYISSLTSVLGFYAYVMLAWDYESFGKGDGTPFLNKAETVYNAVPPAEYGSGWSKDSKRLNRYNLIDELLEPRYAIFNEVMYDYHLAGLDLMYDEPDKARGNLLRSLEKLQKVVAEEPNLLLTQLFSNAKGNEIAQIFSVADNATKTTVSKILKTLDPVNSDQYIRNMYSSGGR